MKRILLIYAGLLVLLVSAMIGVTQRLLELERSEQRLALSAESERLALWRMESQLLPLVLEESTRDYAEFTVGGPARAIPPSARGYFRSTVAGDLALLWSHLSRTADPPPDPDLRQLIADDARRPEFIATLGELSGSDTAAGPQPVNGELAVSIGSGEPENSKQQASRSQTEFLSRTTNTINGNALFLNQSQRLNGFDRPASTERNPMTAFWVEDRLYLARNTGDNERPGAEGCLFDWERLQPALLASIRDLLPEAELAPLAPDEPGDQLTLANLPIRLIPGPPAAANLPVSSPLKPTLIIAWSCFLLGIAALGGLLFGVARLSERRAAFVSAVTHELRTPLTTFRLYSDLLSDRDSLAREKYDRYIETLKTEAERLEYLIENVLSWSRLERSAETQAIEPLAWNEFYERIRDSLSDRASQAGLALEPTVSSETAALRFLGNRTAVERILFNLIDNACKYARHADDPQIQIEVSGDEGGIDIAVQDRGPGIRADVRPRLFQPFSKSAREASGTAPGIGLGLSLARRLARDMGGDLQLSETSAEGTRFTLRLRRAT